MGNNRLIYIVGGVLLVIILVLGIWTIVASRNKKTKKSANPPVLTIWNLDDDQSAFENVISDFESGHDIKIEYLKKNAGEYLTEALNQIAAGKGPDIWIIPNDWMPAYHDKLVAMPDEKFANKKEKQNDVETYKATFVPVAASDNIINDKIYGMPMYVDYLNLYFNTTIFGEAINEYRKNHPDDDISSIRDIFSNGPKNWDDFVTAVRIIRDNTDKSAVAMGTSDNVKEATDLLTMIMLQNGTKMVADDHQTATFHTSQNVFGGGEFPGTRGLEFYTNFAKEGSDVKTWDGNMPDSLHAFAEEKTAMMFDYLSSEKEVKNINSRVNYMITNVPQIKETKAPVGYASYTTMTVTKAAENPDLAWDFIISATSPTYVNQYRSVTKKPEALLSKLDPNSPAKIAAGWYKPEPDKADNIFKDMIRQVLDGTNVQTAIDGAASQITSLLEKIKQ